MPKPIRITAEMKRTLQAEFEKTLEELKMSDGKISYVKSFKYQDTSAVIWLTPLTYNKIIALVNNFQDEVGWHELATRKDKNEFVIEDVLVYPQEVTGSTVNTDQKLYTEWLYEQNADIFNQIRMQGHSHVNMGVSPSGVDDGHREKILDQLDDDMFYIFMIWNKSLKTHSLIYDMANNILYEDTDIVVKISGNDTFEEFLSDAQSKVQKKVKTATKPKRYKEKKQPQRSIFDYPYEYGYPYDPYEL